MYLSIFLFIVLCCSFGGLFAYIIVKVRRERQKTYKELSGEPGIFVGPSGEPLCNCQLPTKVDDFIKPRYVYENLVESTDYLPENGRIIGYRIGPSLVIHSRVQKDIYADDVAAYIKRLGGKLLEQQEAELLAENWDKISILSKNAGELFLICQWFWGTNNGMLVAYCGNNPKNLVYKYAADYPNSCCSLILKR